LKAALENDDAESISSKTSALAQASMKLGEAMYQAQQGETATEGQAAHNDDGVVDAEFEEVKDDKQSA
jgi:molecular chaperone DnaK